MKRISNDSHSIVLIKTVPVFTVKEQCLALPELLPIAQKKPFQLEGLSDIAIFRQTQFPICSIITLIRTF
jgi:hypothetical protein